MSPLSENLPVRPSYAPVPRGHDFLNFSDVCDTQNPEMAKALMQIREGLTMVLDHGSTAQEVTEGLGKVREGVCSVLTVAEVEHHAQGRRFKIAPFMEKGLVLQDMHPDLYGAFENGVLAASTKVAGARKDRRSSRRRQRFL